MRPNNPLSLAGALNQALAGPGRRPDNASQTQRKTPNNVRLFSVTASRAGTWLEPSIKRTKKMMKGRARVATGGSTKGTTVAWGDYGLRMMRMGKGKGAFDHWAARVAVNQIVLELKGMLHEQVARDAFRLAGNKLPGQWEFVKKGEPPVVGITKLDGVTLEELKRPRRKVAAETIMPVTPADPAKAAQQPLDNP
ncbi:hypothetical protein PG994_002012 [Apiospora phragmitis]|uniref:50S ribosomal protein L16 n=1 Tax=Apiospora phragmitis TaxID=2905665 RepID=A0ABR1WV47_9PEZI